MITLLSALTISAFAFTNPKYDTGLAMQAVYFEAPAEDIVNLEPVAPVEIIRSADMNVIYTDDQKPAFDITLAEVTVNTVKAYQFTIEGRTLLLAVKNQRVDECNSVVITAVDAANNAKLELIDHSKRACKDMVDSVWEANVKADSMSYAMTGQPL